MTKIKYGSFEMDSSTILDYIKIVQYNRKYANKPEMQNEHAAGIVNSLLFFLATNDMHFDNSDTEAFDTLKKLIEEAGYDAQGHYSEQARQAYRYIYAKQGLNPDNAVLQDILILTPRQKAWQKVKSFFTKSKSNGSGQSLSKPQKNFSLFSFA